MKTWCKKIDPTDAKFIEPFVITCVIDKLERRDYSKFVAGYSELSPKQIRKLAKDKANATIVLECELTCIAEDVADRIRNRSLDLQKPRITRRRDGMNGKMRDICIESIMHQVIEHVVVRCMDELWSKKLTYHQYASLKKKGQLAGAKTLQKWTKHHEAKYYAKGDVTHCFGSFRHDIIMKFLRRDIGKNKTLLWCVEELLKLHSDNGVGLLIGSLLSQFLSNYMLSYAYRYAESLCKYRRNNRIRLAPHVLFFMDDYIICGNNRRNLQMAMKKIERYMINTLGIRAKIWNVENHDSRPIDMMGYVIRSNGKMKVRHRIYRRARRCAIRLWQNMKSLKLSRRFSAYFGYLKYARVRKIKKTKSDLTLRVRSTIHLAAYNVRTYDRRILECCA